MRISDWSSDVCSSDLPVEIEAEAEVGLARRRVDDLADHRHVHRDDEKAAAVILEDPVAQHGALAALRDDAEGRLVEAVDALGREAETDQVQTRDRGRHDAVLAVVLFNAPDQLAVQVSHRTASFCQSISRCGRPTAGEMCRGLDGTSGKPNTNTAQPRSGGTSNNPADRKGDR